MNAAAVHTCVCVCVTHIRDHFLVGEYILVRKHTQDLPMPRKGRSPTQLALIVLVVMLPWARSRCSRASPLRPKPCLNVWLHRGTEGPRQAGRDRETESMERSEGARARVPHAV
jgi:hypothetical protein